MIIDPNNLSPRETYAYLSGAVAPRPICFASTVDAEGNVNLSPFSFFNVVSGDPPLLAFSPLLSGRDGSPKDTLNNVRAVPEVTINIVNHAIVEQMSLTSTAYPSGVNEFEKAALTQVQGEVVKPPLVAESPVSFECKVDQILTLGDGPMGGSLIIARVVRIHVHKDLFDEQGVMDIRALDLVGRMGGADYIRAIPEALFEIPKPVRSLGIGIDGLPPYIRNSTVLTGNNLGRLGNVERLPTAEEISKLAGNPGVKEALTGGLEQRHRLAQAYLERGETELALTVLMA
ncbi:flavin reductase family protein [Neolewinella aurantiaca]|uniref:Flavin reductase family protein n=1 Tax=Neolewinella aurantiaca TaxID=2602767 RepID=A0A5C7FR04_9BACT|nr:flavin reductase family protein [Neolewinella aurantiaca]TXF90310.1 flavin reductase family protein [Neolewinella aurantiaca]